MNKYDYWAGQSFVGSPQIPEKEAVDYLLKGGQNPYPHDIPDLSARITLSALALIGDKEYARAGTRREVGGLSRLYQQQSLREYLRERLAQYRDLLQPSLNLSLLPTGSFTISFTFTLTKPYISRDDTALHLLDNPLKKEWVFKLPYVASTQWKGTLQATMVRLLVEWWQGLEKTKQSQRIQRKQFVARRIQLTRLFGTEAEDVRRYLAQCGDDKLDKWHKRYIRRFLSGSGFLAGRLYFYPSFFTQTSLEIINPHDRKSGAGSQPIYFEAVPAGADATFTLLYTPLDRTGKDEVETRRQVLADLQRVTQGLEALFTVYGFGAKTSSGFGLVDNSVSDGSIVVGGLVYESESPPAEMAPVASIKPDLPRYLVAPGRLHPDFVSETGGLKVEAEYQKLVEAQGKKYAKRSKQLYAKAKSWWEREGQQFSQQPEEPETGPEPATEPSPYPLARKTFDTFADLPAKAQKLSDALQHRGVRYEST